jgi:hypothetical protein
MMKHLFLVFLFLPAMLAGTARAADAGGLFEAAVPVADQSDAARDEALRHALAEVLVRVTGDTAVAKAPEAASLLENARRYVGQFSYERRLAENAEPASEPRLFLLARFDGAALERAVRQAGLPFWGAERPATLVWLAYQNGPERGLVGADSGGVAADARSALQRAARVRGVPLVLPLLDTEDRRAVSVADIWGGFDERILAASQRYAADTVLVGKLQQLGSAWQADWRLIGEEGEIPRWQSMPAALPGVLSGGIDPLADAYAARFALRPSGDGAATGSRVELHVLGIGGLREYGTLLEYLRDLTLVRSLQVERLEGEELVLGLQLSGDVEHLERAIALGRRLQPAPRPDSDRLPEVRLPALPGTGGTGQSMPPVMPAQPAVPRLYYRDAS